jgi:3-dehydroquinate dehydratase-1
MKFRPEEKICVSLAGETSREVIDYLPVLRNAGAKLIELRLDFLKDKNYSAVLKAASKHEFTIISTVRNRTDGGVFSGSESERRRILLESASTATYVDIEYDTYVSDKMIIDELRNAGAKILISKHFQQGSPRIDVLERVLEEMRLVGDLFKIVTTPQSLFEATNLLSLYRYSWAEGRLIAFCMGEEWTITRVLSVLMGAPFTYAHGGNSAVASGQLSFIEMKNELEKLSWMIEKWLS